MTNSNHTSLWMKLNAYQQEIKDLSINEYFRLESDRLKNFTYELSDLFVDFSLNRISQKAKDLLIQLAVQADLSKWIDDLFAGKKINFTENRAALHMLLRNPNTNLLERQRLFDFAEGVRSGRITGSTGKKFKDIITIGVGGSGLGPQLLSQALNHQDEFNLYFVSSMDGEEIASLLRKIPAETALFIIVSKSFTTIDTLANANTAKDWLHAQLGNFKAHMVGVSENKNKVLAYGIDENYYFNLPAEVGGRYSVWSAVSLGVVIAIGKDEFSEFLAGGHIIDVHFKNEPFATNVPVILGLLDIWYLNFFHWQTRVILPYTSLLKEFPFYLQQLEMESCGKSIDRHGKQVKYETGPIIWGDVGFLSQHSFYQLLHQGTQIIPADFIIPVHPQNHLPHHQHLALMNALAQIKILVEGDEGANEYQRNEGNKPVTIMLFAELTPKICGMLIALYEHKVFTKSIIWGINPFDQWGVEAGKKLAKHYLEQNFNLDKNKVSLPLEHIFQRVNNMLNKS